MKSILSARLNDQQGVTELFFAGTKVGWLQRTENGMYEAHSFVSDKIYQGKKVMDVCLPIEKELDRQQEKT